MISIIQQITELGPSLSILSGNKIKSIALPPPLGQSVGTSTIPKPEKEIVKKIKPEEQKTNE